MTSIFELSTIVLSALCIHLKKFLSNGTYSILKLIQFKLFELELLLSFNFTYFCFIVLSIGEGSNQEVFDKRLKTHTVDKKEVKEDEIKKKYITLSFFIL